MSIDSNIWTRKNKPLLLLAPMAGYTDSAFRQLCREFGADIVMTELVSADAIAFGKLKVHKLDKVNKVGGKNQNTAEMLQFSDQERPLVVQLFGKYPEKFAKAARWVSEELKPDGIDINMGCPARKVVGSDHGAALLKSCPLAVEIVRAVRENTKLPVSVKTRLGWDSDDQILDFAPQLIAAGIDAIIVHGRTYKDGFKGKARWDNIYLLKSELRNPDSEISRKYKIENGNQIAVIGNGDIGSYDQAIARAESGPVELDGVAIGRASFGQPWIFRLTSAASENVNIKSLVLRHAQLVWETKGEHGIIEFRKHLLAYLRGFPGAKQLRMDAVSIMTLDDVSKVLNSLKM